MLSWKCYRVNKVHEISVRCSRPLVVVNALNRLFISCFIAYRPLKLPLSCEVVQRSGFWAPICRESGHPRFWTCVFKLHLPPTMWSIFVEFRSASSEIRAGKKKESVVKHKSADMYVGRPKEKNQYRKVVTEISI